jgi:hypothetical protein
MIAQLEKDLSKLQRKREKIVAEVEREIDFVVKMLAAAKSRRRRVNGPTERAPQKARLLNRKNDTSKITRSEVASYIYNLLGTLPKGKTMTRADIVASCEGQNKRGEFNRKYAEDMYPTISSVLSRYTFFKQVKYGEWRLA